MISQIPEIEKEKTPIATLQRNPQRRASTTHIFSTERFHDIPEDC